MSRLGEQGGQRVVFPCVRMVCPVIQKLLRIEAVSRASKDMLRYNVGMALLLSLSFPDASKKSCLLSPPLRFT